MKDFKRRIWNLIFQKEATHIVCARFCSKNTKARLLAKKDELSAVTHLHYVVLTQERQRKII